MIVLPAEGVAEAALWHALFDLADRTSDWTLIGARMVQLHAAAAGRTLLRTHEPEGHGQHELRQVHA